MNDKADRLKAALRENLKRRKAHMRDRDDKEKAPKPAPQQSGVMVRKTDTSKDV